MKTLLLAFLGALLLSACTAPGDFDKNKRLKVEDSILVIPKDTPKVTYQISATATYRSYTERYLFSHYPLGFKGGLFVLMLNRQWYLDVVMAPEDVTKAVNRYFGTAFKSTELGEKVEINSKYGLYHFWKFKEFGRDCVLFGNSSNVVGLASNKHSHFYGYLCETKSTDTDWVQKFIDTVPKIERKSNNYTGQGHGFWVSN
ncbi:MAG: hypothetical protein P1V34_01935 [Alphaproteobacteria bacterium]|nr:hypothetical protein [Alphaproteobacteria bacterium]